MNLDRIDQNEETLVDSPGTGFGRGDELDLAIVRRRLSESGLDYSGALEYLAVAARWITGSDGAAVAMGTEEDPTVRCLSWHGIAPPLGTVIEPGSGISGLCLSTSQPVLCTNTETDHRVDPIVCQAMNIRSIAIAPVFREQTIVGLIEVFSSQIAGFDGSTLVVLSELASLVAEVSARENSRIRQSEDSPIRMPRSDEEVLSGSGLETSAGDSNVFPLTLQAQKGKSPAKLIALGVTVIALGVFGVLWTTSTHHSEIATRTVVAAPPTVAAAESELPPPVDSSGAMVKPLPVEAGTSAPTFQPQSNAPLENIRPAQLIYRTKPDYPGAAAQAGITGRVTLQAKISKEGRVVDVHILSGAPILADAAVLAVKRWRYRPTEIDGHAIDSSTNIVIDFPEKD